ncbi:MAG TPA: hydrogenase maturation protease [Chloroflexia bacterium]|nr:hydrogenase maturation protease [Chloroflexia bacterium]
MGTPDRGDDAVGREIARRVRTAAPGGVRVVEASGEGTALMDAWRGVETVILCDAAQSGAPAGTVHRLEAHVQPVPDRLFRYSTHAFGVAQAIELARVLGELPSRVIVYGVEGAGFAAGAGLSPAVAQAVEGVVDAVLGELAALPALLSTQYSLAGPGAPGGDPHA